MDIIKREDGQIGLHGKMWAVTPLDKALITKAHMRPFDHVSEALAEAFREKGPDARVTVIMDGGLVMPKLDSRQKAKGSVASEVDPPSAPDCLNWPSVRLGATGKESSAELRSKFNYLSRLDSVL